MEQMFRPSSYLGNIILEILNSNNNKKRKSNNDNNMSRVARLLIIIIIVLGNIKRESTGIKVIAVIMDEIALRARIAELEKVL